MYRFAKTKYRSSSRYTKASREAVAGTVTEGLELRTSFPSSIFSRSLDHTVTHLSIHFDLHSHRLGLHTIFIFFCKDV